MHTIIINTMGSELRQNQLFYLPFQVDRFHWIEKPLAEISQCPDQIVAYHGDQGNRDDYHVILLVPIAQLKAVELKAVRQVYMEMLRGYLNEQFLYPLCQRTQLPPTGVSIVFMLREKVDGQGNVEVERELDEIFDLTEDIQEISQLILRDKNGNAVLDVSRMFDDSLTAYRAALEEQQKDSVRSEHYALETLRRNILVRIKDKQECKYIPVGREDTVTLNCDSIEFAPLTTDWDLCCLDLQLNLCEHLQANLNNDRVWKLKLIPHEAQDLRRRILLAIKRVNFLQRTEARLAYFNINEPDPYQPEEDISSRIWTKLQQDSKLPGIRELQEELKQAEQRGDAQQDGKTGLGKKLRQKWLLIGQEKKRFEETCEQLEQQYSPEEVNKQQKEILDICAGEFGEWRRQVLTREESLPKEATETELPEFDSADYEAKLADAHRLWGSVTVEQLEDYEDVRKEAEQIKAKFRKAYRLWPDGEVNATTKFFIYSVVLALVFVLQMMLPYIGITMGQEDFELSRYVHFLLSLGTFVTLYAAGVLLWMNALCKKLCGYTREINWLLVQSRQRRNQSIAKAVELYGAVLPKCTAVYEQLQRMRKIHEKNLQRKERFNAHEQRLGKAEELLYELQTQLRLYSNENVEEPKIVGGINYEKPPSDEENVRFYVFMSEKWGKM